MHAYARGTMQSALQSEGAAKHLGSERLRLRRPKASRLLSVLVWPTLLRLPGPSAGRRPAGSVPIQCDVSLDDSVHTATVATPVAEGEPFAGDFHSRKREQRLCAKRFSSRSLSVKYHMLKPPCRRRRGGGDVRAWCASRHRGIND